MRGFDKWESYLPLYRTVMDTIPYGAAYLELGSQNLGWLRQLDPEGRFKRAIACDVNPLVADFLEGTGFTECVVGDSTSEACFSAIKGLDLSFSLISDDASHTQRDVLLNFFLYWPLVIDGGTYVIEDVHTDFSKIFKAGNYFGISIYEFFSSLPGISTSNEVGAFFPEQNPAFLAMRRLYSRNFCDEIFRSIKSVSFLNSMIVVQKGANNLGKRVLEGDTWPVVSKAELSTFTLDAIVNESVDSPLPLAIVYLNRAKTPDELRARARFMEAYLKYPPNVACVLYVVNKGFSAHELEDEYLFFLPLSPRFINLNDNGTDLTSYREACQEIDEPLVFFMNTHSEPIQENWLVRVFEAYVADENVVLVGCSASSETAHPYLPGFTHYPNFHVRTNGFMVAVSDFLAITERRSLSTKEDAYRFESGRHSLTRTVLASGKKVAIVSRIGQISPKCLWRASIFRSGRQSNLLIADNQSRTYQYATVFGRMKLFFMSHSPLSRLTKGRISYWLRHYKSWRLGNFSKPRVWTWISPLSVRRIVLAAKDWVSGPRRSLKNPSMVVLVPTHLEQLDDRQSSVLLHNLTVLRRFDCEVLLPEHCNPQWFETFFASHGLAARVRLVSSGYFGGPREVNRMGMDPEFYRNFLGYDYLLVCHLDAWVYHDNFEPWLNRGFDFIGAPLFLPESQDAHFKKRMAPFGANGGLSLRRVAKMVEVLEAFNVRLNLSRILGAIFFLVKNKQLEMVRILLRLIRELRDDWRGTVQRYNIYEDVFFTVVAPMCGLPLRTPSSKEALRFSCEVNYTLIQKEILGAEPPLGVHGFDKYNNEDFWAYASGFFGRKKILHDAQPLGLPLKVSVIMLIKDLLLQDRLGSFNQAFLSVSEQTFPDIELLIVDGGSSDETFQIVTGRYGHLPRVTIHQIPDNSIWEGMANAVKLSTGDLVAVLNSDDFYVSSEAISTMVEGLAAVKADMVFSHASILTNQTSLPFPTHLPSVLNCFGIVHQSVLMKKSVIECIDPFLSGHRTAENYLFLATLVGGFKIAEVPESLVAYRTGGASTQLYGGTNEQITTEDYVSYMKKLTTIGLYLRDEEIAELYGLRGLRRLGEIRYFAMILRIQESNLRRLLLQSGWHALKKRGLRQLLPGKIKSLRKRKRVH